MSIAPEILPEISPIAAPISATVPARPGRFGAYGGRYVPETLMAALEELEAAYAAAQADPAFHAELDSLLADYAGRPTPLYYARRLSEQLGGARRHERGRHVAQVGRIGIGKGRMKVCIDQARQQISAREVDPLGGGGRTPRIDAHDAVALDGDAAAR